MASVGIAPMQVVTTFTHVEEIDPALLLDMSIALSEAALGFVDEQSGGAYSNLFEATGVGLDQWLGRRSVGRAYAGPVRSRSVRAVSVKSQWWLQVLYSY